MASEKQIRANRKNADKSLGPKTTEGKASSSLNALKHGILSDHVYISTSGDTTDFKGFSAIRDLFFEEMKPLGILETLLVDRLFTAFWRLRRLHIAESGFIRKQLNPHHMQSRLSKAEAHSTARKDAVNTFFQRMRTSDGCQHLADGWQVIAECLQENGLPLSKGMSSFLDREMGGTFGLFKTVYVSEFNWIVQNNGGAKPMTPEDKKQFDQEALRFAIEMRDFFRGIAEILEWDEENAQRADLQTKFLPPSEDLEKLQRYDAHLQRVFMQTLHELQRVQAARLGRAPPMSAALDVTLNTENGFVS